MRLLVALACVLALLPGCAYRQQAGELAARCGVPNEETYLAKSPDAAQQEISCFRSEIAKSSLPSAYVASISDGLAVRETLWRAIASGQISREQARLYEIEYFARKQEAAQAAAMAQQQNVISSLALMGLGLQMMQPPPAPPRITPFTCTQTGRFTNCF